MTRITAAVQIQAARAAVWRVFSEVETWHQWNREVLAVQWTEGQPRSEGATFDVEHRTLFGATRRTAYQVRMWVEGRSAVYETVAAFPLATICTVQLVDSLGGCRLDAAHHYRGAASPLVRLLSRRQQRLLEQAMTSLKARVEGSMR